jgi:hypothetical protein
MRFWVSNGIGLAIVLLELILYIRSSNAYMLGIALFVLVLLGLSYLLSGYVQPRKFASDKRYAKPFTLTAGETDIRLKSEDLDKQTKWSDIRKVWETPRYYLLFLDETQFWIAPKEVFESREQEEQFRQIVGQHQTIRRGLIR